MYFFKQLIFFLVLSGSFTCISIHTLDNHNQDIISILKVIGKAIESELSLVNIDDGQDDADWIQVGQFLQQELPIIVAKVSNAVKHDLTKNQQAIVIDLLHNCQNLSVITIDDLMVIAKAIDDLEKEYSRECLLKAAEKYIPEKILVNIFYPGGEAPTREEQILMTKELEKIDLHNKSFNLLLRFLCQGSYLMIDIDLITKIDLCGDKSALPLQKCCEYVGRTMERALVVGWEKDLEKIGRAFLVLNPLSNALLKSIKHH